VNLYLPVCCKNFEFAHVGTGYSIYFSFKKILVILMLILTGFVAIPSTILVGTSLASRDDV